MSKDKNNERKKKIQQQTLHILSERNKTAQAKATFKVFFYFSDFIMIF